MLLVVFLTSCETSREVAQENQESARLITVADGLEIALPHEYQAAIDLLQSHGFTVQHYTANSAVATKRYDLPIQLRSHSSPTSKVTARLHQINLAAYSTDGTSTVIFEQLFNGAN